MNLELFRSPNTVYARVSGRFVLEHSSDFHESVMALIDKGVEQVAVHLKEAAFIDTAGRVEKFTKKFGGDYFSRSKKK